MKANPAFDWRPTPGDEGSHLSCHPHFILRDVKAKRRLIDLAKEATSLDMTVDGDRRIGSRDTDAEPYLGDQMLQFLALAYADRSGYREEWRP